eukprot:9485490-Pyramimonas_sp.AAC.1
MTVGPYSTPQRAFGASLGSCAALQTAPPSSPMRSVGFVWSFSQPCKVCSHLGSIGRGGSQATGSRCLRKSPASLAALATTTRSSTTSPAPPCFPCLLCSAPSAHPHRPHFF